MSNSRSSRSWTISMWSSPRKPQRKPKPSASDVSGSKWNDASFSRSFSSASRSSRILAAFDRIEPGEDHRLHFLEAGERLERRAAGLGDRVADLRVADRLDVRRRRTRLRRRRARRPASAWARRCRPARPRSPAPSAMNRIFMPGADDAVDHARQDDRRRGRGRTRSRRSAPSAARRDRPSGGGSRCDDRLEDLVDAGALLRAREDRAGSRRGR